MTPIPFKRRRFPPLIIQHAVWLYARFALSIRDVGEMLAGRGIGVSNERVRRWFLEFGRLIAGSRKPTFVIFLLTDHGISSVEKALAIIVA